MCVLSQPCFPLKQTMAERTRHTPHSKIEAVKSMTKGRQERRKERRKGEGRGGEKKQRGERGCPGRWPEARGSRPHSYFLTSFKQVIKSLEKPTKWFLTARGTAAWDTQKTPALRKEAGRWAESHLLLGTAKKISVKLGSKKMSFFESEKDSVFFKASISDNVELV